MTQLLWDATSERVYQTGLDRGVLYLQDGSAVTWNGLSSVTENFDKDSKELYFDGRKVNEAIQPGNYSAILKAITFPDEFLQYDGIGEVRSGVWYGDQSVKKFGLSYRTLIGDDVNGDNAGYKIHILYNLLAIPMPQLSKSLSTTASLTEFQWKISSTPQRISGFRPVSHVIVDSRSIDPLLLVDLEEILYGSESLDPALPTMEELDTFFKEWSRIYITDNGDGTWTAYTEYPELFIDNEDGSFNIDQANIFILSADDYEISNTTDISEVA